MTEVRIIAHNLAGGADRTATTGTDGAFAIANLERGRYEVSAAKDGFLKSSDNVEVVAQGSYRVDFSLAATPPAAVADASSSVAQELAAMKKRIEDLEAQLQATSGQAPAEPHTLSPHGPLVATTGNQVPLLPGTLGKPDISKEVASNAAAPTASAAQQSALPSSSSQNQTPATPAVDLQTPFADHDWTWLNGNSRQHDSPLDGKYFSGEFRADTFYNIDFNQPIDHSMGGSSEVFRSGEFQLEDLSIGGDFHAGGMRGRVLGLFGMFAATTPRNDASSAVGQWDVRAAYRYVSEAYGGYHFNVQHGLNIDAGIFVSYIGLFSYHNYDNWAYQPSYVSSNTPWFFNGLRVQWFPSQHLKIEPWFINGWQSYNKFNGHPGIGGQLKWTPKPWLNIIANQYAVGNDNIGLKHRGRYHTDDSIEIKYYDKPKDGNGLDKLALSFTGDLGCETGDGVTCHGGKGPYDPLTGKGGPKQSFVGYMVYNRFWWHHDLFAATLGGGQMNNAGRYLTLVSPINGADAISGTPYFPAFPGASAKAYDGTATLDWMPSQFVTFRMELGYRHFNSPYWTGRGGITPPGGNNGAPAQFVCSNGAASGTGDLASAYAACGGPNSIWFPDLRRGQAQLFFAVMVKL
ncbi:MAG: outer membrane beta-barrel protein [Acidobacteriia bacterium]|nr:outer membrane beta-barrel protein [Terriglobia bacterium]